MPGLTAATTRELVDELTRRNALPCKCGRWKTFLGRWDADGYTLRCFGCYRAIGKCACR